MTHQLLKLVEGRVTGRGTSEALAWDDLTGMSLDAGKVEEARKKEMDYVHDKEVWVKTPETSLKSRWKSRIE